MRPTSPTRQKSPRRRRRGANAVEFALIMPAFITMLFGSMDMGWMFFQQALATDAVLSSMRVGAMQRPADTDPPGTCALCISKATTESQKRLSDLGIAVPAGDLTPTMTSVNGVCTLNLDAEVPFASLVGLVPTPDSYTVHVNMVTSAVADCI